jgi:hypothetical protein
MSLNWNSLNVSTVVVVSAALLAKVQTWRMIDRSALGIANPFIFAVMCSREN